MTSLASSVEAQWDSAIVRMSAQGFIESPYLPKDVYTLSSGRVEPRHKQYLPRPECSTEEKVKMKSNLSSVPLRYLLLKVDGVITVQLGKSLRRENSSKLFYV